jgi:uncharacterized protein (TIGR03437 family)
MRLAKATGALRPVTTLVTLLCALAGFANAQQSRINRPVNVRERFTLAGHVHPRATAANDRGRVAASLQLSYVTLTFTRSPSQEADLQKLLADQQNPQSASYHRWLTPEEYADRFGVSPSDLDKITSWLRSEGLTIAYVARGRNWAAVNGSAAQLEAAFQTELHQYLVNGETHFANATEPSVPAAVGPLVLGIRGLHNFRMRPLIAKPRYNSVALCGGNCLAPADFATIYNVNALYAKGVDGTGQKIAVAGVTDIDLRDITTFRSNYGLPANPPQLMLIPGSPDPGVSQQDLPEADLDLEWSGAVAKNATIIYVYASDVMSAIAYAIDADVAPVVSSSYGLCEPETFRADSLAFQRSAQQGNAQGITWVNASGDSGAADCDDRRNPGLTVDSPADVPEVTGVGGTEFAEAAGTYWNTTNNPVTGGSALSYIPETSWNDSANDGTPSASGGGVSIFFGKPAWQTGPGVPSDGQRDVPDVSLNASADHDGYVVQTGGSTQVYGGTSVSAQAFAGIAALVNHYLVSSGQQAAPGLGNANMTLYSLARTGSGIFNDITTGNNVVTVTPCSGRIGGCTSVGYQAGPGYDLVTGLGSVNVENLATGWTGTPSLNLQLTSNMTSLAAKDTVFLIATATDPTGATPAGTVTFTTSGGTNLGSAQLVGSNGIATATLAVTGSDIGLNPQSEASQTITATYKESSSTVTARVTLNALAASVGTAPLITGSTNAASFQQVYAPGMILAVFGTQLLAPGAVAGANAAVANTVPFPYTMAGVAATMDGEAAPLWYVSPTQWNIQIPYETAPGTRDLEINNNGQVTHESITVAAAAPGVFFGPSNLIANGLAPVPPGGETVLYLTGAGAVSPSIATGAAPLGGTAQNALPSPTQTTTITVAGKPVPTPLQFNAIIPGLVGVVQVNFTVPAGVPAGSQPVVVTVGGVPSATVYLTVAASN